MRRLAITLAALAILPVMRSTAASRSCPAHPLIAAEAHARAMFSGSRAIPQRAWRTQNRLIGCLRSKDLRPRIERYDRRLHATHARRVARAKADAEFASSEDDYVPGVPVWFASCVAWYESTDGAGGPNRYGILGSGGTGSLEQQKRAFAALYAARGEEPWSRYDGCGISRFSGP